MKGRILVAACVVLLFFAGAVQLQAEEKAAKMDAMVVSAAKIDTPVANIPASVTVLNSEQLSAQHMPQGDFMDTLRGLAGISITRAHGPFPATAAIRGIGNAVYLIDGIPVDWKMNQAIPVEIIERVEVIRGPSSAMFGESATGGVINIITKKGADETSLTVSGGGGTFSTYRIGAMAQGSSEGVGFAMAGWLNGSGGANVVKNNVNPTIHMIDNCKYTKHGFSLSGRYTFGEASAVNLFYNYFWDDYKRGRVYYGGEWQRDFAGITFEQGLGSLFNFTARAAYHVDDLLHTYDRGGTRYHEPLQRMFTDYKAVPVEALLSGRFFDGREILTVGFSHNTVFQEAVTRAWFTHAETLRTRWSQDFWAVYVNNKLEIVDGLILDASLRQDNWKNYDNFFSNFVNTEPPQRSESRVSPFIGLRYNFLQGSGIWANYSQGFLPPTPAQLFDDRTTGGNRRIPNPDLKPEITTSYEIGVQHWFWNRLLAKVVGYNTYTADGILSTFDINNNLINSNLGKTESKGVEVELELFVTDSFSVSGNYTWADSIIRKNPADPALEGKKVPYAPEHRANVALKYSRPNDVTARLAMRYTDDQFTNQANDKYNAAGEAIYMTSSIVFDAKVTKTLLRNKGFMERMDVSASIDNIFNTKYRTMMVYEDPGTNFYGEVSLRFK